MKTEKRLIDANALKERAIRVSTVKEHCYFKAVGTREIDKAPTVEAEEVVRCKKCKHFVAPQGVPCCSNFFGLGFPHPSGNDFCSYGERRVSEIQESQSL
jgi:hypothetical protein